MIVILALVTIALFFLGKTFGLIEQNQMPHLDIIRKWHKTKAVFQILIMSAISVAYFGVSYNAIYSTIILLAWTAIVFNLSINYEKENQILYLGSKGLEGFFKNVPLLYYGILIAIIIGLGYLILKIN